MSVALVNKDNTNEMIDADKKKIGISGSTIKIIALITMFIDHFAATVIEKKITYMIGITPADKSDWLMLYVILRGIGRIAFPIYIFLLVEGFKYTRNRLKYLLRLIMFAVISEIPFDMAFNHIRLNNLEGFKLVEFGYQNVFFTLACGFAALMSIDAVGKRINDKLARIILQLFCCAVFIGLAILLKTDYSGIGVAAISVMYFLRNKPLSGVVATCVTLSLTSMLELAALIDALPIAFYNGKKGINIKWLFYAFYPVHLFILGLVIM